MSARQTSAEIDAQAAEWVARLDGEGRSAGILRELDGWLSADPRRRGAFLRAEAAWLVLDRLAPEAEPGGDEGAVAEERPLWYRRRGFLAASAAAVAAGLAGPFLLFGSSQRYATVVGEIRRVPLADGSVAQINTASAIDVAIGHAERRIRLREGEAWFEVSKDPTRPFVVEAGRVRVRALGTAFSVRRRGNGADVLVTEGTVEAWAAGAEGDRVRLAAGHSAHIDDAAVITANAAASDTVDRTLAWRDGKIDLAGETLAEAASEFNRYNRRPILIADARLAGERFYGVFRVDDPEGFASAVQRSLDVPVDLSRSDAIQIGEPPQKERSRAVKEEPAPRL